MSDEFYDAWQEFVRQYPLAPWQRWLELVNAENSQPVIRVDESAEIVRRIRSRSRGGCSSW